MKAQLLIEQLSALSLDDMQSTAGGVQSATTGTLSDGVQSADFALQYFVSKTTISNDEGNLPRPSDLRLPPGIGRGGCCPPWDLPKLKFSKEATETRTPDGRIVLDAGSGDDIIDVKPDPNNKGGVIVTINGEEHCYSAEEAAKLTIKGGSGDDTIKVDSNVKVGLRLDGGSGDDKITGGSGDDRIIGGSGDDHVDGGAGDDRICGGSGDDRIRGGSGDDRIRGGSGNDQIKGGSGDDRIFGGSGGDRIRGGSGDDYIYGGSGNNQVDGGSGNNRIDKGEEEWSLLYVRMNRFIRA